MSHSYNYRKDMEQEGFSPEEFVERLAWRTVTSGNEFDPEKLHDGFSEAINDLKGILEMQRLKCIQVENSFAKEEQHLRSRLSMLINRNQDATENLTGLERKVNFVATKVVHLGDQLESVNLPRERTSEAAKLMKHLIDFLQPGSILLSDVFRDKSNLFEAAEIIQKLHAVAQDLTTGSSSTPSSSARFDGAVKKISEKYDEIERSLIDEFVSAQRMNNIERMKQIALILYNFKGYSQCVNAFIEQSQVGGYKQKEVFDDVIPLCQLNKPIIDSVFLNPEHVMGKFILHIFHGKIQETVVNHFDGSRNQKQFLQNLSSLYSKTQNVVKKLKSYDLGYDSSFLEQITEQIFRKHMDNYITLEIQCLQQENDIILRNYYESLGHQRKAIQSSFQDFRRDIQAVIGTRANINIAQIENFGGETFLSEEVAINLLQESRLAYSRCSLLSKKLKIATNAGQIFEILTSSLLREHVDYALELGLQGIPIADGRNQPEIYFFDVVKRCNAIVHLYEKEFIESLVPLVTATPFLSECIEKKKAILEHIELKLDAGIDRSLETIVGYVKIILQSEYSKREFFRSDTFNDMETPDMISAACVKVIRFISVQVEKMKDSMDGKNIEAVLTELGIRLHRVIYEHLLRFEYSLVGALSVTCDVGEYRKCIKDFKIPLLNTLFDTLHALCNLLHVLPSELNLCFNREELMCLDPSIRFQFMQLRTDYKTARLQVNNNQITRS